MRYRKNLVVSSPEARSMFKNYGIKLDRENLFKGKTAVCFFGKIQEKDGKKFTPKKKKFKTSTSSIIKPSSIKKKGVKKFITPKRNLKRNNFFTPRGPIIKKTPKRRKLNNNNNDNDKNNNNNDDLKTPTTIRKSPFPFLSPSSKRTYKQFQTKTPLLFKSPNICVKRQPLTNFKDDFEEDKTFVELQKYKKLSKLGPNFISLFGWFKTYYEKEKDVDDYMIYYVMEKADCILKQYLNEKKKNDKGIYFLEWKNILFQILYALYVGKKFFDFQHNDLHFNNVMLKSNQEKKKLIYYLNMDDDDSDDSDEDNDEDNGEDDDEKKNFIYFNIDCDWIAKLIDFGNSNVKQIENRNAIGSDISKIATEMKSIKIKWDKPRGSNQRKQFLKLRKSMDQSICTIKSLLVCDFFKDIRISKSKLHEIKKKEKHIIININKRNIREFEENLNKNKEENKNEKKRKRKNDESEDEFDEESDEESDGEESDEENEEESDEENNFSESQVFRRRRKRISK